MSETVHKMWLKDKDGTKVAPKTTLDQIVLTDGTKFENQLEQSLAGKQDKLTAGSNITIVDNVISATGGGGGGSYSEATETTSGLMSADDKTKLDIIENAVGLRDESITDTTIASSKVVPAKMTEATINNIGGNSLLYNQLSNVAINGNYTENGVTSTDNGDGSFTLNGTATGDCYILFDNIKTTQFRTSHVKLIKNGGSKGSQTTIYAGANDTYMGDNAFIIPKNTTNYNACLRIVSGTVCDGFKVIPQLFDLTEMFGDGNEPTTVEEFNKIFPNDYYDYFDNNVNLWDELWEQGVYSDTTGLPTTNSGAIRSKNYISILPNTQYCSSIGLRTLFYDADKNFISAYVERVNPFTTPENAHYMRFSTPHTYPTKGTYGYDIAINMGSIATYRYYGYSGVIYPQVESIEVTSSDSESTKTIPVPISLHYLTMTEWGQGIDGVYNDISFKPVTYSNMKSVDLGTLEWGITEDGIFYTDSITDYKREIGIKAVCSEYFYAGVTDNISDLIPDYLCAFLVDSTEVTRFYVNDYTYGGRISEFKYDMTGVMLHYEASDNSGEEYSTSIYTKRIANVDLGTLTWSLNSDGFFSCHKDAIKAKSFDIKRTQDAKILCHNYEYALPSLAIDKNITQTSNYIRIYDSTYTDVDSFKIAMNCIRMYYEMATPITIEIEESLPSLDVSSGDSIAFKCYSSLFNIPTSNEILYKRMSSLILEPATTTKLGGIKVGENLSISNGVLSAKSLSAPGMYYGYTETAGKTAEKVVVVESNSDFKLEVGATVLVYFKYGNGIGSVKLNVNDTGAYPIKLNGDIYTGSYTEYCGNTGKLTMYMFDGEGWAYCGKSWDNNENYLSSPFCQTAAATPGKTATCTAYSLSPNTYTHVLMRYTNTSKSAISLNINGSGAKPIYINGKPSSSTNYNLPGGTYLVYYDGTAFQFRTDGTLPGPVGTYGMTTDASEAVYYMGDIPVYRKRIFQAITSGTTECLISSDIDAAGFVKFEGVIMDFANAKIIQVGGCIGANLYSGVYADANGIFVCYSESLSTDAEINGWLYYV